jgi:hypothetical protein
MYEKLKVGDVEMVKTSDDLIRITEAVIDQNKMILEMNARLLAEINTPRLVVSLDNKGEKDGEVR